MTEQTGLTRIKLVLNSSIFGSCTLGGSPAGVVPPLLPRFADESPSAVDAFVGRDRASLLRRKRFIVRPYSVQQIPGKLGGRSVSGEELQRELSLCFNQR